MTKNNIEAEVTFRQGTAIYKVYFDGSKFFMQKMSYDSGKTISDMTISSVNGWEDLTQLKRAVDYMLKWKELQEFKP